MDMIDRELEAKLHALEEFVASCFDCSPDGSGWRNTGITFTFVDACVYAEDMELYLPWENFNDFDFGYSKVSAGALEQAFMHHPDWASIKEEDVRLEMGRYTHLILGQDLKTPCQFLICYTNGGKAEEDDSAQVIRLADSNLIPVFDFGLGIDYTYNQLTDWLVKNT